MSLIQIEKYDSEILKIISKEMPYFSDTFLRVPFKFGSFPKNIKTISHDINKRFLDKHESFILDKASPGLKLIFQNYQAKQFSQKPKEGLFSDLFKSCNCPTKKQIEKIIRQSMPLNFNNWDINPFTLLLENTRFSNLIINPYIFAGGPTCTSGAELHDSAGTSNTTGWSNQIVGPKQSGVADRCYNQIAFNVNTPVGNMRVGCYDNADGGDGAANILSESGSHSASSGFNFISVTEFTIPEAICWTVQNSDSGSNNLNYSSTGTRVAKNPHTFGVFEDPITGEAYPTTFVPDAKVSHT